MVVVVPKPQSHAWNGKWNSALIQKNKIKNQKIKNLKKSKTQIAYRLLEIRT